jgi:3-mercaptopyruvate sulfurtransferase SseA
MDADYNFLPKEQLAEVYRTKGGLTHPESQPVILTCQRGITACIINFGLEILGNNNTSLYDGSLSEYAQKTGMDLK